MALDQAVFDIRCEWGLQGVARLAPVSDVVIIVDVFSFSTCVDVVVSKGSMVYPYGWRDNTAAAFAASVGAELARPRWEQSRYTLSPASLRDLPPGARLVLPSPNGSTLSLATGGTRTLTGCLRNASAVAAQAQRWGNRIAVVPAGERWPEGQLRPALEDLVAAGAIISALPGECSPEAQLAVAAFRAAGPALAEWLRQCGSGQELIERGFAQDVALASAVDVSVCAPVLRDGAYVDSSEHL